MYLGTFEFDKGRNDYGMVVLSNESSQKEWFVPMRSVLVAVWETLCGADK